MKKTIAALMATVTLISSLLLLSSCGSKPKDRNTPWIGGNEHWWIGNTDTGISARGPKGDKGANGADGLDGASGISGTNGLDAQNPIFRYNVVTMCLEASYDNGATWLEFPKYPYSNALIGTYDYPMSSVEVLDGTIANISNRYMLSEGYRGALIPLSGLDFDTVTITPSVNTEEFGYTFLNEKPIEKRVPEYSEGYYEVIWQNKSDAVVLSIPSDAKYLYVYYASEGVIYLPKSVVFSNTQQ